MNLINITVPDALVKKALRAIDEVQADIHDRLARIDSGFYKIQTEDVPNLIDDVNRKLEKTSAVIRSEANEKALNPAKDKIESIGQSMRFGIGVIIASSVLSTVAIVTTCIIAIMKMAL